MDRNRFSGGLCIHISLALFTAVLATPSAFAQSCTKVILEGDITAGQEWKAPIGGGWMFRIVPVPPLNAGYSGWDLMVDRDQPAGFPDALYLATPPYRSINEREIGTTYGLRAQDAIGWNPRSFRFLVDPHALRGAQSDYYTAFELHKDPVSPSNISAASSRLLKLVAGASQGELRILDAHLSPGLADPVPYAERWAAAAARMQHEVEANGAASPLGKLSWMRFSLTLWLSPNWKLPPDLHGTWAGCGQ
jgi:hypothetical protein